MKQLNMNIFKGFVVLIAVLHQICAKEVYQMDIDERGTKFNETIEINNKLKTVVYKVPSHNNIMKSEYLVDYKHGYLVTKIPEQEVCYVKVLSTADEPSLRGTKQDLKLLKYYKANTNEPVPVKTVNKVMKIIREIPRDELSPKMEQFCGNNTAYQVKEFAAEKSVVKRAITKTKYYTYSMGNTVQKNTLTASLPAGYIMSCKTINLYNKDIQNCVKKNRPIKYRCGLRTRTCRYQATCYPVKLRPFAGRPGPQPPHVQLKVKCEETHVFTSDWCCEVFPC